MERMLKWADEINARAKENISKAQAIQKKVFDAKHRPPTFEVGDKVWVYNSRRTREKVENWHAIGLDRSKLLNSPLEERAYRVKNQQGKELIARTCCSHQNG